MKQNNLTVLNFKLPGKALMILGKNGFTTIFVYKLARLVPMAYCTSIKIVNQLEDLGLVETTKEGRRRYVKLTDKGRRVTNLLTHMESLLIEEPKHLNTLI